jgi:hypothetical protein
MKTLQKCKGVISTKVGGQENRGQGRDGVAEGGGFRVLILLHKTDIQIFAPNTT